MKKVLVNEAHIRPSDALQVVANVQLNLLHQRLDGNERAAQRLGGQDAIQLFQLFRGLINFGVLRRV